MELLLEFLKIGIAFIAYLCVGCLVFCCHGRSHWQTAAALRTTELRKRRRIRRTPAPLALRPQSRLARTQSRSGSTAMWSGSIMSKRNQQQEARRNPTPRITAQRAAKATRRILGSAQKRPPENRCLWLPFAPMGTICAKQPIESNSGLVTERGENRV